MEVSRRTRQIATLHFQLPEVKILSVLSFVASNIFIALMPSKLHIVIVV